MNRSRMSLLVLPMLAASGMAQTVTGTVPAPSVDRWNYPFASQPGIEVGIPTFAALRQTGFDDRDAQFLLGFDTGSVVPTGLGAARYVVESASVTVYVSSDLRLVYDPTFDSVRTSFDPADPGYQADADAGKPVELFPVGYRNGFTDATFGERSPYSPFPAFPPREGVRHAFAAAFDASGLPTVDVSRHVRQRFDAFPIGVGVNPDLQPGTLVPAGSSLTFAIDLSMPNVADYLARGINAGHVRFMVSSLHPASGGPGGGTGDVVYPTFFTKENPLAATGGYLSSLTLRVTAHPGADFNIDGGIDGADIEAFFIAWQAGESHADFNLDGGIDGSDIESFFLAWENGGG